MAGIWLLYLFVAPLAVPVSLLFFVPSYWTYAVLFRQIDGPLESDSAGACWQQAVRYTNWTYHLSHALLVGILASKGGFEHIVLVLVALGYAMARTYQLRVTFGGRAAGLSLQKCVALHEAGVDDAQPDSLAPYATPEGLAAGEQAWAAASLAKAAASQ